MSSILKALKKLDAERNAATGQTLASSSETAPVQRPWLPLVAGIVLGGVAVAALLVWSKSPQPQAVAVPPALQVTDTTLPPAPPAPAVAEPVPVVVMPAETPVTVARPAQTRKSPTLSAATPVPPERNSNPLPASSPPVQVSPATVQPAPAVVARQAATPPAPTPKPLSLVVTDIFFAEGGDSMAVVNDLPVMEGTLIEGAEVLAIRTDRVIFLVDEAEHVVYLSPAR